MGKNLFSRTFYVVKIRKIKRIVLQMLLVLVLITPLFAFNLHKEYHSLTNIDYNKKEKALQITMRLFTNDIDLALKKYFEKPIELGSINEIVDANKLLELYLNQKFILSINNEMTQYQFLGKEFEKDELYLYMEIKEIEKIEQISVQNAILTELFFEQENIIKLNINDQQKSIILTKENDKGMLKF